MSILDALGIDPEDFTWEQLSACNNMDVEWFYDSYESDETHAKNIDALCINCPVLKACLEQGIAGKEEGVWGGTYLANGKPDKIRNKHKSSDTWKTIQKRSGVDLS